MPPRLRSAAQNAAADAAASVSVPNLDGRAAAAAVAATVPDLPPDALDVVFSFLAGDVASLCAAACVKRSWCAAALQPALWRDLRFAEQLNVARRLTDTRLERLVRRAGAALRCLDLASCGDNGVTLRGVVNALRGAPLLKQLGVRGAQYAARHKGPPVKRFAQLSALVCPDGLLDAAEYEGRLALCDAEPDGTPCRRLCGAEDALCDECVLFHCPACLKTAEEKREPPCEHLCDSCFKPDDDFFDCANCGGQVNGHCFECIATCQGCEKIFCEQCAFYDGDVLAMCSSGCCRYRSDALYCYDCIYPAALHRHEERKLIFCEGCGDLVCPRCMDQGAESGCEMCDSEFCGRCRKKRMTKAKGMWMCTKCESRR